MSVLLIGYKVEQRLTPCESAAIVFGDAMPEGIRLRPCRLEDVDGLVEIYREGFEQEIAFFFKRFCRCFFQALFRLLVRQTIVAESDGDIVGFVITVSGARSIISGQAFQLMSAIPALLASAKPNLYVYILQKLRNTEWGEKQVGIACIAVKREWRREGIGKSLMREALARYPGRNAALEVRMWNESAVRLYTNVGFRRTGGWKDPLGEWVVMKRLAPMSHTSTEPGVAVASAECLLRTSTGRDYGAS